MKPLALLFAITLTACANIRTGQETAALATHLAAAETANTAARADTTFIRSNLSRADGKATVILEWLDQHRQK